MALSWVGRRLPEAQPSDLVFMGYVAFSGALILFFGWSLSFGLRAGLILVHLALLALSVWFARQPVRDHSWFGVLRDVYPIALIVFLYWELRFISQLFTQGYHDPLILALEEAVFGEQISMTFSRRWPVLWMSELFHLFYSLYWILLPLAGAGLYLRGRIGGFRELIFVEQIVFYTCYIVFIFFPVAGPHYQFPAISGALAEGNVYRFVHWVLEDGGSMGAAFPSSHVAVAVAVLLVAWRHDKLVMAVMLPLVVGLTVGTVYGRFHYGVDTLSGVIMGLAVVPLALYLQPLLVVRGSGEAGNSLGSSIV